MKGVIPAEPPSRELDLRDKSVLSECLGDFGELATLKWHEGTIDATVDVPAQVIFEGSPSEEPVDGFGISALVLDAARGALWFRFCPRDAPGHDDGSLMCRPDAETELRIIVAGADSDGTRALEKNVASPAPQEVESTADGASYSWNFEGPPQPVHLAFGVPVAASAATFLNSQNGSRWPIYENETVAFGLNWAFLAFATSALMGLVALFAAVRAARVRARIAVFGVGLFITGGVWVKWPWPYNFDQGGMLNSLVIGWLVIGAALSAKSGSTLFLVLLGLCLFVLDGFVAGWLGMGNLPFEALVDPVALGLIVCSLAIGLRNIAQHLDGFFRLVGKATLGSGLRSALAFLAISTVTFALAFPIGSAVADTTADDAAAKLSRELVSLSTNLGFQLTVAVPLVIVAWSLPRLKRFASRDKATPLGARMCLLLSLATTFAIPWAEGGTALFVINLPLWIAQLVILFWCLRHRLDYAEGHLPKRPRRELLRRAADSSIAPSTAAEAGAELLSFGPKGTLRGNASAGVRYGTLVGVAPVAYFVWTTLGELDTHLDYSTQAVLVTVGFAQEVARWMFAGFAFGLLYRWIPGRIGPVKALWFSSAWIASALVPTGIARGIDVDSSQQFVYRAAQLALVVVIVAVAYDRATIRSAGGDIRDLPQVYALSNYTQVIAAVAPGALLAVTVAQQILTGSGLDVAEAFVTGVQSLAAK